jgi:hypothetical protein
MNRWSPGIASRVGQDGDPPPGSSPEKAFIGIDMMRDRDKLAPGMVAQALNKRMRTGSCMKRPGNVQPLDFNPPFAKRILGSGLFNNPNGENVMLVACLDDTAVWVLQYGKAPYQVALVAGENLAGLGWVRFAQAFQNVVMFRPGKPNLVWDGDPAHQFVLFATPAAGSTAVPSIYAAEPFENRLLYYYPAHTLVPYRDQILVSDAGNHTGYDNVFGDIRINSGRSDSIMRVWAYNHNAAVIFKRQSVHMLQDFTGKAVQDSSGLFSYLDYSDASQKQVTTRHGLCSMNAVVEDGGDLLYLSEPGGIYRLSEVIQEQIVVPPTAVSTQIQPVIDLINWPAAFGGFFNGMGSCAETLDDYAYFAVPIYTGPPAGNNAVLVYNRTTRQWESAPDWWMDPTFRIHAMHVTNYGGAQTLFGLDYVNRRVYAMYQHVPDEVNDTFWHIHDSMATRGYNLGDPTSFKRFQRAAIVISTLDPQVTVTAISDGYNEQKNLTPTPITKDRLHYYPHAHPDFDEGVNDPDEPMREDYTGAELVSNFAGQDFQGVPLGPVNFLPPTSPGSEVAPAQESLERLQIRTNARWCSLEIENVSGRCDVLAVGVEAIASAMETRTAA